MATVRRRRCRRRRRRKAGRRGIVGGDRPRRGGRARTRAKQGQGDARPRPREAAPAAPLRSNFSETAFLQPQLLTDATARPSIEFTVPDSVTSWNVWVHARHARPARRLDPQGDAQRQGADGAALPAALPARGRQAELKVVVNNASDEDADGRADARDRRSRDQRERCSTRFGLTAAQARARSRRRRAAAPTLTFADRRAAARRARCAFKVDGGRRATSPTASCGRCRCCPRRMHLAQSRFVDAARRGRARRMTFADLAQGRRSHADQRAAGGHRRRAALLHRAAGAAVPRRAIPYECTEQTLNRFVSTGIVSSASSATTRRWRRWRRSCRKRETPLETFDAADPNRKMALEETPWLRAAQGGRDAERDAHQRARSARSRARSARRALAKLRKAQTSSGAFPWFPGGPPSPYMTLYLAVRLRQGGRVRGRGAEGHGAARLAVPGAALPRRVRGAA